MLSLRLRPTGCWRMIIAKAVPAIMEALVFPQCLAFIFSLDTLTSQGLFLFHGGSWFYTVEPGVLD